MGGRSVRLLALAAAAALVLGACGTGDADADDGARALVIGAIPDQDTDRLQEIYGATAEYLAAELGVPVEFRPVTDYTASVSQFRTGDLDLVWFGGLTGVQARQQTPGSRALIQRDIDDEFRSVVIAGTDTGLAPFADVAGLEQLRGRTLTFGSSSSTSGYLMPAYFMLEAGVDAETDLAEQPGFSGSHDATVDLVEAGTYEAGVLNEQVWDTRVEAGTVDTGVVVELWRSPTYADYHWVLGPRALEDFGEQLADDVTAAFTALTHDDPEHAELLELFGAGGFVPTDPANYAEIEEIGRRLGLVQ